MRLLLAAARKYVLIDAGFIPLECYKMNLIVMLLPTHWYMDPSDQFANSAIYNKHCGTS